MVTASDKISNVCDNYLVSRTMCLSTAFDMAFNRFRL